jgi:glycosyltransferase involved in cell wall biosynthesis
MSTTPRLSIGLPVYNAEEYLAESIEALLGQTFDDFELIISDNASTDSTPDICRRYAARDGRIRYVRQPRNIGLAGNHNYVFEQSRGELFKWAASDDLYDRNLLRRCVDVLDADPGVVLAHCYTAMIEGATGEFATPVPYRLSTSDPSVSNRFRSLLLDAGGDDDYGVIRSAVLRKVHPYDSYFHADRTFVAEIALHGRFHQVPDWLFFRRQHPGRSANKRTIREWCVVYDQRRADPLRHPVIRLLGEYVLAYIAGIRRAPLTSGERRSCYGELLRWLVSRAVKPARPWLEAAQMPVPGSVSVSLALGAEPRRTA